MNSHHTHNARAIQRKDADDVRQSVRESYSKVAEGKPSGSGCCGPTEDFDVKAIYSTRLGYQCGRHYFKLCHQPFTG